ncbi:hypothetical protein HN011_001061 [Eciton burchellii]|nr:hypothetical protein HN011_001061 [Eciton burchellii]
MTHESVGLSGVQRITVQFQDNSLNLRTTIMSEDLNRKLIAEQTMIFGVIKGVIINDKKLPKTSVTLQRTRARLSDLLLDSRITFAAAVEDKSYLTFNDEFYTAEDAYNDASDQLQDAISNFVKAEIFCMRR